MAASRRSPSGTNREDRDFSDETRIDNGKLSVPWTSTQSITANILVLFDSTTVRFGACLQRGGVPCDQLSRNFGMLNHHRSGTMLRRVPLALFTVLLLVASGVQADPSARPFWTEQAMFRFGDELFFTGVASCAGSAEEGRQRAYQAAMQEVLNYAGGGTLHGIPIETQMLFEDPSPAGCPSGTLTVWRLLRIPEVPLDALAKRRQQDRGPSTISAPA